MKKTLILSCALVLASLSTSAMAAEGQGFVRGEIGNTEIDMDLFSDDDTSYSVRGGYWFNANFAVEGFYSNLYEQRYGELSGFGVGMVGKKNFGANNSGFFISGRAGLARLQSERNNGFYTFEDTSTKPYIGVGAGYDFSESFGLSVNYDRQNADLGVLSIDTDTVSAAAEFRF